MKTIRIEPYKLASAGSKRLAKHSGILRTTKRQLAKHAKFDILINWGNPRRRWSGCTYLNPPEAVEAASDKVKAMELFAASEVPSAPFTTSKEVAQSWLAEGKTVIARTLTRASSGRGIVIVSGDDTLPSAPLYVEYLKKKEEFRVHVFGGKVIDIQQKRRRLEVPDEKVNWQVRNHDNGWVFARTDIVCPDGVKNAACLAISALNLDFGAVDIGWNSHTETACVYEVNTAPGLEGTTIDSYFSAITEAYPQIRGGRYALRRRKVV